MRGKRFKMVYLLSLIWWRLLYPAGVFTSPSSELLFSSASAKFNLYAACTACLYAEWSHSGLINISICRPWLFTCSPSQWKRPGSLLGGGAELNSPPYSMSCSPLSSRSASSWWARWKPAPVCPSWRQLDLMALYCLMIAYGKVNKWNARIESSSLRRKDNYSALYQSVGTFQLQELQGNLGGLDSRNLPWKIISQNFYKRLGVFTLCSLEKIPRWGLRLT